MTVGDTKQTSHRIVTSPPPVADTACHTPDVSNDTVDISGVCLSGVLTRVSSSVRLVKC